MLRLLKPRGAAPPQSRLTAAALMFVILGLHACERDLPDRVDAYATVVDAVVEHAPDSERTVEFNPTLLVRLEDTAGPSPKYNERNYATRPSNALAEAVGRHPQARLCLVPPGSPRCRLEIGDRFKVLTELRNTDEGAVVNVVSVMRTDLLVGMMYYEVELRRINGRWVAGPLQFLGADN